MTSSKPDKIDYAKLLSKTYEIASVTFSDKESILYALGIGFNLGTPHIM